MDLKLLIGRMVGDYQIKKLLGAGGMGAVFLGWHQHMKLPFAVKVLRPEHAQNQGFLDRFFQEAHLGAQLRHENAVSIHNAGIADLATTAAITFTASNGVTPQAGKRQRATYDVNFICRSPLSHLYLPC